MLARALSALRDAVRWEFAYIGYVPRERPPFSALKFRSGASPFYSFCRSRDHNFLNFAAHGRLTQPSSVNSVRSPALSSPSHVSSLWRGAFFTLLRRSGVSSWPECQPDASYSLFRRPTFSCSSSPSSLQSSTFSRSGSQSSLRSPAFLRSSLIRSPLFFTLPQHIPTKIWDEYPPPPPRMTAQQL